MKTLFTAIIALAALSMNAQNKIGHINSLELLNLMPEVQQADAQLKELQTALQQQYNSYVTEYQTKVNEYNANAGTWGEVQLEAAEQDIASLQQRITDFESSSQQKLETRRQELYDPILQKANTTIEEVGKDGKFTYIIDTSSGSLVFMGEDMIDALPLVLKKLGIEQSK